MGIQHLNKFFRDEAQQSIKFISLTELSGKKIAVDISIYMYKYASEESLLENMYLMLSIFRYYNIIPVFIFDGKPPPEKKELLLKRKESKQDAEKEYNKLKTQLEINAVDNVEKQEIISSMDILKKKFIHISKNDIDNVKNLIRAYGASYYDAPGEADELCALLVIKHKVWACLSEDMDMFVYGCARVIRYLSLLNKTAVLYDTKEILSSLGVTQKELREICVISGTDYNYTHKNECDSKNAPTLYKTLSYFKKYNKDKTQNYLENLEFYDWLREKTDYIKDYDELIKIYNLFELNNEEHAILKNFENVKIMNGSIVKEDIRNIIRCEGFIFPESKI
jgi:5'-3' exonuclease